MSLNALSAPAPGRAAMPGRALLLGLLLAVVAVLTGPSFAAMAATWANSTTYTYGFLIPPIVLWLLWRERAWLRTATFATEPLVLPVLLGASILLLLGQLADTALVQQVASVALLVGSVVLVIGRAAARRLWFPLGFLFLMIPVGDGLVAPLQDITASFALPLLALLGIPTFRDGVFIDTPAGQFQVAEACAGLRFLIANIVLGVLFAHLSFRATWKKILFVGLCAVVPVLANGLRATGIIAVASWTDMRYAVSADHLIYGWGFFTLVMVALLALGNWFADPAPAAAPNAAPRRPVQQKLSPPLALAALAAVLAGPAYGTLVLRQEPPVALSHVPAPAMIAGWPRLAPAADWRASFTGADRLVTDSYAVAGGTVDVVIGFYTHQRQGAEAVYHTNRAFDGEVWNRARATTARAGGALPATLPAELLNGPHGAARLAVTFYWIGGHFTADARIAKLLQLWNRLSGGDPAAAIIAVSTPLAEPEAAAAVRLQRFLCGADFPATLRALQEP